MYICRLSAVSEENKNDATGSNNYAALLTQASFMHTQQRILIIVVDQSIPFFHYLVEKCL